MPPRLASIVDLRSVRCRPNVELRTGGLRLIVHECREYWCFRVELLLLQRLAPRLRSQHANCPICSLFQPFT
jgi:hypothetical protein